MKKMITQNLVASFIAVMALCFGASEGLSQEAKVKSSADDQTKALLDATVAFMNSLAADQLKNVQFPFTPEKAATAARFARGARGPGGGRGPGGPDDGGPGGGGPDSRFDRPDRQSGQSIGTNQSPQRRRGGGPGMGGGFGGFTGEQYGNAVWSNFPVSDVPRPGLALGSLNPAQRGAAMHLLQVLLSAKGYEKVREIMGADQVLMDSGAQFSSGTNTYVLGIFGTPSTNAPWMLEFGGHQKREHLPLPGRF
jgi:hypothetical protein